MRRLTRHPSVMLVLLCYAVALFCFLVLCTVGLVQNRLAYASGALAPATLTRFDFELNGDLYEREDGALVTAGADPQLLLKDTGRLVENVTLHFEYSRAPRVVQVFWAAPGQDYDLRKAAYPFGEQADAITFLLPAAGGASLRIDPDSEAGAVITFHSVTINQMRPFWQFYLPTAGQGLMLAVVPLLVASGTGLVLEAGLGLVFLRKRRSRAATRSREGAPHG